MEANTVSQNLELFGRLYESVQFKPDASGSKHQHMSKFTFTTKETYLSYRANWKKTYRELSDTIRLLRFAYANNQRGPTTTKELAIVDKAATVIKLSKPYFSSSFLYAKQQHSAKAFAMLWELHEAKLEAQRQYETTHAKVGIYA